MTLNWIGLGAWLLLKGHETEGEMAVVEKKNVAFSFKKNEQVWIYQEYIFLFVFFFFFIILLVHCTISMIDTHLVYYNNWNEDPVDMPYTTSHQNPTLE